MHLSSPTTSSFTLTNNYSCNKGKEKQQGRAEEDG